MNKVTFLLVFYMVVCFFIQDVNANMNLNVLVFDVNKETPLPKAFRSVDTLKISGSGQFTEKNLKEALKSMQGEIWIIDLRRESHGFVDGMPISWYYPHNKSNDHLNTNDILETERQQLQSLTALSPLPIQQIIEKKEGNLVKTKVVEVTWHQIFSEKVLAEKLTLHYLRLPVQDHHHPDPAIVDDFLRFVKSKSDDSWLYFHCRGGKGRTTTFMVLMDILKNAKTKTLKQILESHAALGGSNFSSGVSLPEDKWKQDAREKRKRFIEAFYDYVKSTEGYPATSWQEWSRRFN